MPPTGTQYQWWHTPMSQRISGIGKGCPGHHWCGTVKLSVENGPGDCGAKLGSAWAVAAAKPTELSAKAAAATPLMSVRYMVSPIPAAPTAPLLQQFQALGVATDHNFS